MTQKIAAGNWKMNGLPAALSEIEALVAGLDSPDCDVLICPPATLIGAVASKAAGSPLTVGGQDCHQNAQGAHTGDISAAMLRAAGASHVILGHSERRADHGEDDTLVNAKARTAWTENLNAIICVGETEQQRDAGDALSVVIGQLRGSLPDDCTAANTVVAYEPVWAIGTGRTPTPEQIAEAHAAMRDDLATRFGTEGAAIPLLYGGSVKAANADDIFALDHVDGALVGGASLKAVDFLPIIGALSRA
jgi:triosephosphate isomerase